MRTRILILLFLFSAIVFGRSAFADNYDALLTVTNTNDSGPGSLRDAINASNATQGVKEKIVFAIPGSGPKVIVPLTSFPIITDPIIIDGTTQAGYVPCGGGKSYPNCSIPMIELDGEKLVGTDPTFNTGLLSWVGKSIVRGLDIYSFPGWGISMGLPHAQYNDDPYLYSINGFNNIESNYIGFRIRNGIAEARPNGLIGIQMSGGPKLIIGGTKIYQRNVISGNAGGAIFIAAEDNHTSQSKIWNNYIGTDPSGQVAVAQADPATWGYAEGQSVDVEESDDEIGGAIVAKRNLIAGNSKSPFTVWIAGDRNVIQGNYIGTDITGLNPLPNGGPGILISGNSNQVGGTTGTTQNIIRNQGGPGISVSSFSLKNTIIGNSIDNNGALGIDLLNGWQAPWSEGPDTNDLLDADGGANGRENYPTITSILINPLATEVIGTLQSTSSSSKTLHFYYSPQSDSTGFGEGKFYLGALTVNTDAQGQVAFDVTFPKIIPTGSFVSGTSTNADGSTSEFSAALNAQSALRCGDDHLDLGEECDDGNTSSFDGCRFDCHIETCGDGIVQAIREGCDLGADNGQPGSGCKKDCTLAKPGLCGNSQIDPGEQCDDGNQVVGDGCNTTCQSESCGDGIVQKNEECDDGNPTDGDGCSSKCIVESCGDGIIQNDGLHSFEVCDDGNTISGDGCSSTCTNECGNGVIEGTEACDDGNTNDQDGCNDHCQIEHGFTCDTEGGASVCSSTCGDGLITEGEECDDGNNKDGDGCDSYCRDECGDGVLEVGEACDDNNLSDGDGCSAKCQVEASFTCEKPSLNIPSKCVTGGESSASIDEPILLVGDGGCALQRTPRSTNISFLNFPLALIPLFFLKKYQTRLLNNKGDTII